ncbi:hypothetical protein HELRODRAFT_182635 [Helobdella robusta]|uniref:Uncharacterized protein n=1 Tax=Helobdella robusta TaxID=6412 RepID=T1FII6_HELRO|nr:hypothetical protein HELRODRAFT_182635 [Helobdella robusta]ESN90803.1 hypothetical protein HELRODRAFT_182635 [Helobdella robusta]
MAKLSTSAQSSRRSSSIWKMPWFQPNMMTIWAVLFQKDVKIIVGDKNAKIGSDNIGFEEVMGKYGVGDRNDRGESLVRDETYFWPMAGNGLPIIPLATEWVLKPCNNEMLFLPIGRDTSI